MKLESSATRPTVPAIPSSVAGPAWGAIGILAFSFTVPLTRFAVEALSPLFIGAGRAVIAAALAAAALALTRQRVPRGRQWARLAVVAGGVVIGFPFFTSFALAESPASRGAVVIGLLPAATAVMAVVRGRERPSRIFWAMAVAGAIAAVAFAAIDGGGLTALRWPDLLLLAAVVSAALGYAEGGLLARELGAWQTVSWALVLAAPVMIVLTLVAVAVEAPTADPLQWAAFAYLAAVSMYLGFFAWYRGLAIGPISRVSQVQLVQPVLSILWAALLLGEVITLATALGGVVVIACAGAAVRVRQRPAAARAQSG